MGQLPDTGDGRRYVSDFDDIRIDKDSLVFTIAFVPRSGTDRAMPPWAADLAELGAVDTGPDRARRRRVPGGLDAPAATAGTGAETPARPARRRRHAGTDAHDRRRHHHHGRLMRAVVLVGGFGTRLRPLTDTVPEVDAAGRPRAADRAG